MFFNGHLHSALLHNKTVSSRNKKYREMETSRDISIHSIGIPKMSDTEERKYEQEYVQEHIQGVFMVGLFSETLTKHKISLLSLSPGASQKVLYPHLQNH